MGNIIFKMLNYVRKKRKYTMMINISCMRFRFLKVIGDFYGLLVSRYDVLNYRFEVGEINFSFVYCNLCYMSCYDGLGLVYLFWFFVGVFRCRVILR